MENTALEDRHESARGGGGGGGGGGVAHLFSTKLSYFLPNLHKLELIEKKKKIGEH